MPKLTQTRLKELLHYDPKKGVFAFRKKQGKMLKGYIAGNVNKADNYRYIMIDYKNYKAPRLAWLYMTGSFPKNQIEHRNRIRYDDRWENLEDLTQFDNMKNTKVRIDNKSNIKGVHFFKSRKCWIAQIGIQGANIFLCSSKKSKIKVVLARWEAERKYNFPDCYTTSSSFLYLKKRGVI